MPYPATHLYVAHQVAESLRPCDIPAFYLGCIAPDSVIFLDEWSNDDKYVSHLCAGDESYGDISNRHLWSEHVLSLWHEWSGLDSPWFHAGWICHVFLDLHHTDKYLLPCKRNKPQFLHSGIFRKDLMRLDYEVYLQCVSGKVIPHLLQAVCAGIKSDVFTVDQLQAIQENVSIKQYRCVPAWYSDPYECIGKEDYLNFLHHTAKDISRVLTRS